MGTDVCATQLFNACNVLFGSEVPVSLDFLRYLQMPGLKAVYRKKALETHPDRAMALACPSLDLEERFKEINAAYQELHNYLENPERLTLLDERFAQAHQRAQATGTASGEGFSARRFTGAVPKRVLLFGQYVYYQGFISYRQLIEAIVWQKMRRPLFGTIAVRWGWLDDEEVREILGQRRRGEKFGESALRAGYLSANELRIILGRQRMLQPKIGKYFIEQGILPVSMVETMAVKMRHHNRTYRSHC
ncbi:MAG: DnaJ domain-containing protein [Syntrophales bacterium]